jgi:hypothetical protein
VQSRRAHSFGTVPRVHLRRRAARGIVVIAVTARGVPEIRARMTEWACDPGFDGAGNWFRFFLGPHPDGATESRVFDRVDDVGATIAGTLAVQVPAAELFHVSADTTDLARHAADTLTGYPLHPEDLPAQVGVMVYEHPPVKGTASEHHNEIAVVSWDSGHGGLWVHTRVTTSPSQRGVVRIGHTLAQAPQEEVLARTRTAAAGDLPEPSPESKPSDDEETAGQAADHILATFLSNLKRAPVPPSSAPPHGCERCALTPMEFTEMEGWPGRVSEGGESSVDTDARTALQRNVLATWLLMGQILVRWKPMTAPRATRRRIERVLDPRVPTPHLRRARTEPSDRPGDDSGNRKREYRHWGSCGHRPIWVDLHFVHPEDKPLLGGERMNVLRR